MQTRSVKTGVGLFFILLALVFSMMPSLSTELKAASIIVMCITLWAGEMLPQWFTALAFFVLCAVADIVPNQVFLSGFTSPAIWLLTAGSIIGLAIDHTGLGVRFANMVVPMMTSYRRALLAAVLLGHGLIFLIPSSVGRIMVLLPLLFPVIEQLGYANNHRAKNGILLAAILSTFLPAFTVLPANVPNNVLLGLVDNLSLGELTYGNYLLLHYPVLGFLKSACLLLLLNILFSAPKPNPAKPVKKMWENNEKILLVVLFATLLLWFSQSIHGIGAAWVAMISAMVCLLPNVDLTPQKPLNRLNVEAIFYVAAIVSVGAVAYQSGLAQWVASMGMRLLPFAADNSAQNFGIFSLLSTGLAMLVTLPGTPAILTPMTSMFSEYSGWSTFAVYMTQVIGFSTVIFPYQAPPLVVGMQLGKISLYEMMRVLVPISVLTILLLWPLDYVWWCLLGVIK